MRRLGSLQALLVFDKLGAGGGVWWEGECGGLIGVLHFDGGEKTSELGDLTDFIEESWGALLIKDESVSLQKL